METNHAKCDTTRSPYACGERGCGNAGRGACGEGEAFNRFIAAPAETAGDILLKIEAATELRHEPLMQGNLEDDATLAALADLRRMAGGRS